ncbi:MAG: ethanolamine permease [Myxococcales bacterium]|nr:ethanolamine permease [Myxococcales bacterium]
MQAKPQTAASSKLERTLGPVMIWGLGVGYVISGEYFGWNLGLPAGGTLGMLVATGIVTVMYVCFVLSYAEVACAIPRAGGAFVYADRAFGRRIGFLVGLAQLIEFVFAPPAIALAIGAYFNIFLPSVSPLLIAVAAYVMFTGLNIYGVKLSAMFELVVTVLAVGELLIFAGVTLPHFDMARFTADPLPNGWAGVLPAIPFAIWFYLAIEGIANIAEEAKNPQRDIAIGFSSAMVTLVVLALLTFVSSVGVDGWRSVVFDAAGAQVDKPLPLALGKVVGENHPLYHLLITVGLFGLVASFHGIILVAGRATLEFGRVGYLPKMFGRTLAKRHTPAAALIGNMFVGFIALATGHTGEIITLSVFGALTLYAASMGALFVLRRDEPELERPFRTPLYPFLPAVALVLALGCLVAVAISNALVGAVYLGLLVVGGGGFVLRDRLLGERWSGDRGSGN